MQLFFILLFGIVSVFAQSKFPTLQELYFSGKVTPHSSMLNYLYALKAVTPAMQIDTSAHTVQGRCIPVVKFVGNSSGKELKVLYFAQQHGDEPSGKEGMLMLINELAVGTLKPMLKNISIIIVPQMNPDGAAVCKRRNGNGMDLNRNHLILSENETTMLHELYHSFAPDITVDFHEYSPYSEYWTKYGAIKNTDEQIGVLTNPAIPLGMREYQNKTVVPYLIKEITKAGFSSSHYLPGGPPETDRIRYSTTDINDGRQGLGSFGSLSFIIEGKNGKDCNDNILHRAKGQFTAARSLLQFAIANKSYIQQLVKKTREEVRSGKPGSMVSTVNEHTATGEKITLNLLSVSTGKDTTVVVSLFHPAVTSLHSVTMPLGYLIPKTETELLAIVKKRTMQTTAFVPGKNLKVTAYKIEKVDTITVEEDPTCKPEMTMTEVAVNPDEYVFLPLKGTIGRYAVMAFEPFSLYGVHKYPKYAYLLKANSMYPILRVENTITNHLNGN